MVSKTYFRPQDTAKLNRVLPTAYFLIAQAWQTMGLAVEQIKTMSSSLRQRPAEEIHATVLVL